MGFDLAWVLKGPSGGTNVNLTGVTNLANKAAAQMLSTSLLSGRSNTTVNTKSSASYAVKLAAMVTSTVTASITKSTGRVALASRTAIEVFGRLTQPGALQLLGAAFVKVFSGLSAPTGRSSLRGQMILSVKPTASATFSQRMFGYSRIAFTSAVNIFGAVNLAGRSRVQSSGRAGWSRLVLMAATAGIAVRSQLSAATGKASLAARSTFEVFARLSQPGALQLLGASFIKVFSRLSAPTGKSSLQGQMVMTLRSTSSTTFTQKMSASARLAVSSVAQIFSGVGLSGTSKAHVIARAGLSRLAVLSAAAVVAIRGVATASGKTSLTAKTSVTASARGNLSGVLPIVGMLGATMIRAAINGVLYIFLPSRRVAQVTYEDRTAQVQFENRTAPVKFENRAAKVPIEKRTAQAPFQNRTTQVQQD